MKLEEEREGQSNETNSFTVQARIVKEGEWGYKRVHSISRSSRESNEERDRKGEEMKTLNSFPEFIQSVLLESCCFTEFIQSVLLS